MEFAKSFTNTICRAGFSSQFQRISTLRWHREIYRFSHLFEIWVGRFQVLTYVASNNNKVSKFCIIMLLTWSIYSLFTTPEVDTISLPQHSTNHLSKLTVHMILFSSFFMFSNLYQFHMQSNLHDIMPVATKVRNNNKEVWSCWHDFVEN